jgi:hypothetical protein
MRRTRAAHGTGAAAIDADAAHVLLVSIGTDRMQDIQMNLSFHAGIVNGHPRNEHTPHIAVRGVCSSRTVSVTLTNCADARRYCQD